MIASERNIVLGNLLAGRHIFVTGGTGFVGRSLLDKFQVIQNAGSKFDVTVLSRNPDSFLQAYPEYGNKAWLRVIPGSLTALPQSAGRFTDVIHAAADTHVTGNGAQWIRQIVNGTEAVLDLAVRNGADRFLLTSSGAVYGRQEPHITHLSEQYVGAPATTSVHSTYGQAKRLAEQLCTIYHQETGLNTVIARCFAFVGKHIPLDGPYAIGNFIRDALARTQIRVRGDGTAIRSYLAGDDMADWLLTLLLSGVPGQAYNVGSDSAISMADLADLVRRLIHPTGTITIEAVPQSVPASVYVPSVEKARQLGLSVQLSLEDSILETARSISKTVALSGG